MNFKGKEGITLIALVITIIVLIILAGVSINLVLDQNGIINKAKAGAQNMELAKEEEERILTNLQSILDNGTTSNGGIDNGGTEPETPTWTWNDSDTNGTKNMGDVVTHSSGASFYIISTEGDTYALFAAKNIDTTSLAQSDSAGTVNFCSSPTYRSLGSDLTSVESLKDDETIIADTTSAVYYARKYAESITGNEEDGRLMLYDEADRLKDSYSSMIYGTETTAGYLNYWLGSARDSRDVWVVYGEFSSLDYLFYYDENFCGVRPVIEISKSLIS